MSLLLLLAEDEVLPPPGENDPPQINLPTPLAIQVRTTTLTLQAQVTEMALDG